MDLLLGMMEAGLCQELPAEEKSRITALLESLPWLGLGLEWSAFEHEVLSIRGIYFEDVIEVLQRSKFPKRSFLAWFLPTPGVYVYGNSATMIAEMNAINSSEPGRSFLFGLNSELRTCTDYICEYDGFDRLVVLNNSTFTN